jgi:hypothetical protein
MQGKKALELVRHNRPTNLVVAGRVIPLMLHCIALHLFVTVKPMSWK